MIEAPTADSARGGALARPIEHAQGVTPKRAKEFRELGVRTVGDLLEYFPRTYRLESEERAFEDLIGGNTIQTARGQVVAVDYVSSYSRPRFEATLEDQAGRKLGLAWFNGAYLRRLIHPGIFIRVKAKVRFFRDLPQMTNPKWELIGEQTPAVKESSFRPIYPATADLTTAAIAKVVQKNLEPALDEVQEWFEPALLKKHGGLMDRGSAYRAIHQPRDWREAARARRRIIYDELMLMQLGLGLSRRLRDGRITAPVLRVDMLLDQRIRRRFPFEMTRAQQAACYAIVRDVSSGRPMHRLLQGDVGSGKTVVALYGMLVAIANKMQAALLAPTEVLAEQHYLTLSRFLEGSSVTIELLTSRTKRAARSSLQKRLAGGQIHLAIGTQALIQEDVEFANLGLVVVDEQHKLGVRQRATLKSMGLSPHYLVMTATPIPRTLALSYFADFDVTVLDELPPGRQPIETRWLRPPLAGKAWEFVRAQIDRGRQAYIVLPQIDDDGSDQGKSVLKEFDRLSRGPLHLLRLAVLHGQMPADEKQEVMSRFRAGQIDVLVATTVIEVGIDVPNATVMVIVNADHFGLSQLHQLRGRVGRGGERSHCLLIAEGANETAEARLSAMIKTGDGFEIAEMDLELRGPGQFFGTRQHGLPEFKLADVTSEIELLKAAREDALALLERDPKLIAPQHRHLRAALIEHFGQTLPLAQVG